MHGISGIIGVMYSCEQYELKTPIIQETGDSVEVNHFRAMNDRNKSARKTPEEDEIVPENKKQKK